MGRAFRIGSMIGLSMVCLGVLAVRAQQPATKPAGASGADYLVTPMRVQQLAGADHFLYAEAETNFAELKQTIDKLMPLVTTPPESLAQPAGAYTFVYQGMAMGPDTKFNLRIGVPVKPGTAAPQGTRLGKLEPLRAATVVYCGSIQHIGEAFGKLYGELAAAGLQPTTECRETYVYWEGPESKNNVIILQAGVK